MVTRRQFCREIDQAINDEQSAVTMYLRMARQVPNRQLSLIIREIAADEAGHARTFRTMRALICRRNNICR